MAPCWPMVMRLEAGPRGFGVPTLVPLPACGRNRQRTELYEFSWASHTRREPQGRCEHMERGSKPGWREARGTRRRKAGRVEGQLPLRSVCHEEISNPATVEAGLVRAGCRISAGARCCVRARAGCCVGARAGCCVCPGNNPTPPLRAYAQQCPFPRVREAGSLRSESAGGGPSWSHTCPGVHTW